MKETQHVNSYYAATKNYNVDTKELSGDKQADVCVIGAGFTGLSTALHLVEQGYHVIVLEAAQVGWGATGRNGGQMINGYNRGFDVIKKRYNEDTAKALISMAFEGSDIIRQRVEKYKIECDLVKAGSFVAAFNQQQLKDLEHEKKTWEDIGHKDLEIKDHTNLKDIVNTDAYCGGLLDHKGGHVHALNLALGQARAIKELGGEIYEGSKVIDIIYGSSPVAKTSSGQVSCKYLILCGNAYLGNLVPELSSKIMPISSQIITTEPLDPERARLLMPSNACVEDSNYFLDYYRRTSDNRLLFGGGIIYTNAHPEDISARLVPKMLKVFPDLKGVKIDFAWSGSIAITFKRLPHIGKISDNIIFAHGYSGHGVTTTHLIGKVIAEAVNQNFKRFDVFSSMKHYGFPGGRMFRIPLTALGAWYYGLRDKLGV